MCKAPGCARNHANHYCRICESPDANHLEKNCPHGIDLYHGTRISSISAIIQGHYLMQGGLHPTVGGRIGTGIYFAGKNEALSIAAHRGAGSGVAVLKCRVNTAKCGTGFHPPWAGVNYNFQEWCLNGNNYRISAIFLKDGVINGEINDPEADIICGGSCTFNGSITAGVLSIGGSLWDEMMIESEKL